MYWETVGAILQVQDRFMEQGFALCYDNCVLLPYAVQVFVCTNLSLIRLLVGPPVETKDFQFCVNIQF